jgi:hypothetical protein
VAVATGKYSIDELRAAGADHTLATLESPLPGVPELLAQASPIAARRLPPNPPGRKPGGRQQVVE